ncbi:molybdopterin-dependent oxidoreductase [Pseudomonas fluorescens]|nr:molybdopterin-dependent oxidoreductase [Pseudomonas fluorescens]
MRETRRSHCRNCGAQCGVELEIENGRVLKMRGDRANPISKGYFCIKGLASMERQNGDGRILSSYRLANGAHEPLPTAQAVDEIAARLSGLIQRHGPRSVGLYIGTGAYSATLTVPFAKAWLAAVGSPQLYTTLTIDQSPKVITALRMGAFLSGRQPFTTADVWMFCGTNPLVSHWAGWGGPTMYAPGADIREAQKRGLKVIVVDPRRTETARLADIHLQLRPGQDVAIYAAMLNHILSEGLHDHVFCERYVQNLDALRANTAAYDIQTAAELAGVPAKDLRAAAELFARGPRGCAVSGTGPNMAPHANLAEHLLECLNVVCGRYRREGEIVLNPSMFSSAPVREDVCPPYPLWDNSPKMSSHPEVGWAAPGEFPSNLLADEILHSGEDRLRALIVVGGNPVAAIPDYQAVLHAFESLELLVSLDLQMSDTAHMSDYVLCCKSPYERTDLSLMTDGNSPFPAVQYTEAMLDAPSEAMDEWKIFYELARAMGLPFEWEFGRLGEPAYTDKMKLDMLTPPSIDTLYDFICRHPHVPFARIKTAGSQILDVPEQYVLGVDPANPAKLDVMPKEVADELAACQASRQRQTLEPDQLLLHSRRLLETLNSNFITSEVARSRRPVNQLYIHPADMMSRGLEDGDEVEVLTQHGKLFTTARSDPTERLGAVSMHHAWTKRFDAADSVQDVSPVSILIDREDYLEARNYLPTMSAIPVHVRRADGHRGK